MKSKPLFILFLPLVFFTGMHAQDQIYRITSNPDVTTCEYLRSNGEVLKYVESGYDDTLQLAMEEIGSMNFHSGQPHEIVQYRWTLDTISCEIDSVGLSEVYYTDKDGKSRTVPKSAVFYLAFEGSEDSPVVKEYWKDVQDNKHLTRGKEVNRIVKNDGSTINMSDVLSIDEEIIRFSYIKEGNTIETNIRIEQVEQWVATKPVRNDMFYQADLEYSYLLSGEGNLKKISLDRIAQEKLHLTVFEGRNDISMTLDKDKISGIFFNDVGSGEVLQSSGKEESKRKMLEVNFTGFYGYLYGSDPDSLISGAENMVDDLRSGFGFGIDVNYYLNDYHGLGFVYKYLRTRASTDDVEFSIPGGLNVYEASEDMQQHYLGLNYVYSLRLNSFLINDVSAGVGMFVLNDEVTFNDNYSFNVSGNAPGLHLTNRLVLSRTGYRGFYLELSLLITRLKEVTLESTDFTFTDDTLELGKNDPSNYSRIEIGVGYKL